MAQPQRYSRLPNTISPGLVHFPTTPAAQKLTQELLEKDRETHHCFFNPAGFHNHLSHQILAAYDFGASAQLLQAIYDKEQATQVPIDKYQALDQDRQNITITVNNWTQQLGNQKLYASYLSFFSEQIEQLGATEAVSRALFSEEASAPDVDMLYRFVTGVFHPMIQCGYGTEFRSDAMIAQGLAQAAVHTPILGKSVIGPDQPTTQDGTSLLEIMKRFYDSDTLKPVMPYDPNALISKRTKDAIQDGRPEKVRELCALWFSSSPSDAELDHKVEELFWLAALLLVGTSKRGHKTRLDFFLMHILTSTSFLPSLFKYIPKVEHKQRLLETYLPVLMFTILIRGRPRIDCGLVMQYPIAPKFKPEVQPSSDALVPLDTDPWLDIVREIVHTREAHISKAVRALYIGAKKYGGTAPGHVPGASALEGGAELDGTVFVRAARVVLDVMGWVTRGEKEASWDGSALGWDDAWK